MDPITLALATLHMLVTWIFRKADEGKMWPLYLVVGFVLVWGITHWEDRPIDHS